jgi:hypothetical protein
MDTPNETMAMYCPDPDLADRLQDAAPVGESVAPTDCWQTFQRSAGASESLVVVVPGQVTSDQVDRLATLQRRFPDHALVLAVDRDAENLRRLSRLHVGSPTDCVWRWPQRAARPRPSTPSPSSPPSPDATAAPSGGSWQSAFGPTPPLRLQDFVHWILLIRATALRSTGRRWTAVADDLGVHEHTIARVAKGLAGMNLRQLAAGGPAEVTRRFERRAVAPLLRLGDGPRLRRRPSCGRIRARPWRARRTTCPGSP